MGYNLFLYCETCKERAFVWRNGEAAAIKLFAKRHPSSHVKDMGCDNGFLEKDWVIPTEKEWLAEGGRDITLPYEGCK